MVVLRSAAVDRVAGIPSGTSSLVLVLMLVTGLLFSTVLLATMLLISALGLVHEFVEIISFVVPLIGPALLAGELDPVWLGVLIAMNLQSSFPTPPFAFALFSFRSVAPRVLGTL